MARNTIKFEVNDSEFRAILKKLGAAQSFAMISEAVEEGAKIVADEIKAGAPDSGLPRSSPRKKKKSGVYPYKLKQDIAAKEGRVFNNRVYGKTLSLPYYAQMVEEGTSKMPPRPFIRPATDRARPKAIAAVKKAVAAMVQKAG